MRLLPIDSRRFFGARGYRLARRVLSCLTALVLTEALLVSSAFAAESLFSQKIDGVEPQPRLGLFAEYLSDGAPFFADGSDTEPRVDESGVSCGFENIPFEEFVDPSFSTLENSDAADAFAEGFETFRPKEESRVVYGGSSVYASQDVVIRGSVNLPTLKTIQFWGNGYFGSGHISPTGWNGRVKENNSGAFVGINVPIGAATISAYYNYHRNRMGYFSRTVQQEDDGVGLAAYLNAGGFYMTALGVYGDDGYTARDRSGAYGRSFIGGYQSTGFFETGYEMATLGMFVLKPFGSYQYTNLKHGNFNTATLAQYAGKRSYNSCLMTLGSRVVLNLAGLDAFTLEGRMAWITQLRKRTESIQSFCYGRVPGTVSMSQPYFHGTGAGSDLFWGGIGLRLSLKGTLSISADYDCLVNKYQTLNEGSIGLLLGF